MTSLPDEILCLVCTELWHQRDFGSLFNCACSGKQLATIAVTKLYRIQDVAPIPASDREGRSNPEIFMMRWAGIWRTIILSSIGKTLYPYCHYIRTLDLQNLESLLENQDFGGRISKFFFRGALKQFKFGRSQGLIANDRLDVVETISYIGDSITKQTPLLEELTVNVLTEMISEWIPRLSRMTHLKVWSVESLEDSGAVIRLHCPSFKVLSISDWNDTGTDQALADFLNELSPQSLASFETSAYSDYGPESFQALSRHQESLNELKLDALPTRSIPIIPLFKGCMNLVSLSLGGDGRHITDLEESHNNVFLETVAWLKECKKLRELTFTKLFSAPALMIPILLDNSIRLTSLKYEGLVTRDTKRFHQALGNQTSLRSLWLKENVRNNPPAADILIESLSKLVNLTDLHLGESSDSFADRHIVHLASQLPKLKAWSTNGYRLTDAVWGEISALKSLRTLELGALMNFTADGILDFIEKLGPGNNGLVLTLSRTSIPWAKRKIIQKTIGEKINGNFGVRKTSDRDTDSYESMSDDFGDSDTSTFENEFEDDSEGDAEDDAEAGSWETNSQAPSPKSDSH